MQSSPILKNKTFSIHFSLSLSLSLAELKLQAKVMNALKRFVGFFIILQNASGVVLRNGKWFKFDAASITKQVLYSMGCSQDEKWNYWTIPLDFCIHLWYLFEQLKLDLRDHFSWNDFWWHTAQTVIYFP